MELHFCVLEDKEVMEQMRTKTESIKLTQVPEIAIDGVKKTSEVGDDLLGHLCQGEANLTSTIIKPRACYHFESIPGYTSEEQLLHLTLFITGDQATASFVQSQVSPLMVTSQPRDQRTLLREVIRWQIVPWGASAAYNSTSQTIECSNSLECLANRILACATRVQQNGLLGAREDRQRVAHFLVCFFGPTSGWLDDPLKAASGCSRHLSPPLDSYPQLWQCAVDAAQQPLMLEFKDLTEDNYPPLTTCKFNMSK